MPASDHILNLIDGAEKGEGLTRRNCIDLLTMSSEYDAALCAAADRVRREEVGDDILLRGIIEFSNHCERNCLYCGLRRGNADLKRYRMTEDEILATAETIRRSRISTVVLQSGEDPYYTAGRVCALIGRIKAETGLIIALSIGERSAEDLRAFREAGADRYLLKHETAGEMHYRFLKPGCKLEDRIECLRTIKSLGFETGTGIMVGLPGQTIKILSADLMLMKELDADMLGIGPFIVHPGTPLALSRQENPELTLRIIAIARLLTRRTNIPATTALATLHPEGRIRALQAGANVVMPDFTPAMYKSLYDIYPGRRDSASGTDLLPRLEETFISIGRRRDLA